MDWGVKEFRVLAAETAHENNAVMRIAIGISFSDDRECQFCEFSIDEFGRLVSSKGYKAEEYAKEISMLEKIKLLRALEKEELKTKSLRAEVPIKIVNKILRLTPLEVD